MEVSPSVAGGSTGRFDVDGMLPLPLLGVDVEIGVHLLDMEGWMWLGHLIVSL